MIVALTGGVGAGKSTVAGLFAELGAVIIDADALAREVVLAGTPGFDAVVTEFGAEIVGDDGELDRAKLAEIVFNDSQAVVRLNAIVHPAVGKLSAQRIAVARPDQVVIYDVPLLAETGSAEGFEAVIVVESSLQLRITRLIQRGMSEDSARARMAMQASDEQRREIATFVIDNAGGMEQLREQVATIWKALAED